MNSTSTLSAPGPMIRIGVLVLAPLCLTLGASCTQHQDLASLKDDQHYLTFTGVACVPDVMAGEPVEAGKNIECIFMVEGVTKADVTLSCENDLGEPVNCLDGSDLMRLTADTEFPDEIISPILPMARCRFHMNTEFVDGELIEPVVWVATDGDHTIRKRFAPELIPNDLVNEEPEIWVECEPQALDDLHPGQELRCFVFTHDSDPGDLTDFMVHLVGNPGPPAGPQDFPLAGPGPGIVPWSWKSRPGDPVGWWSFSFTIPGTVARYDLDVALLP